jgi:hypothetical protein
LAAANIVRREDADLATDPICFEPAANIATKQAAQIVLDMFVRRRLVVSRQRCWPASNVLPKAILDQRPGFLPDVRIGSAVEDADTGKLLIRLVSKDR